MHEWLSDYKQKTVRYPTHNDLSVAANSWHKVISNAFNFIKTGSIFVQFIRLCNDGADGIHSDNLQLIAAMQVSVQCKITTSIIHTINYTFATSNVTQHVFSM